MPLMQPEKASSDDSIEQISALDPDLFIVVGYGEILRSKLLEVPSVAAINIHTSLLPKYRGAAPIQRAIMAGERVMGITIMKMNAKMDAGEIVSQGSAEIGQDWLFPDVEAKLCTLAKEEIMKCVEKAAKGEVQSVAQSEGKISLAPKIQANDRELDFSKSAIALHNQIRALVPKPAACCTIGIDGKMVVTKIFRSSFSEGEGGVGQVVHFSKNGLVIGCQEGLLTILELQLEGKKRCTIDQFFAGYGSKTISLT